MTSKKRTQPVQDDDEAFPRGGRDGLTPLEKRQLLQQAEADVKQEQATGTLGKRQRKKSKHSQQQDDAEGAHFALAAATGKVDRVQQLKFRSLAVGMKLLGSVLEVSPDGLMISLPHGLRGSVSAAETSDILAHMLDPSSKRGAALRAGLPDQQAPSLPQLFSVGQYVRCVIKELPGPQEPTAAAAADEAAADAGAGGTKKAPKGNKRIVLSLKLKRLVNGLTAAGLAEGQVVPAVVKSVEDRGYSLSFGIKGVTGFLPAKDYSSYYDPAAFPLLPGSLLDVVVSKAPAAAPYGLIAQVSVSLDQVAGGLLQPWDGLNMSCLLPGALVNCKVRQVCPDGLQVSFGGFFHGSIDHFHLGAPIPEANWQQRYHVGQKLQARLLYVDPSGKRVGLSCLPHLLNYRMPSPVPAMGQVFDNAVVARVDTGLGLLLQLPMGSGAGGGSEETAVGFAHVSNLVDGAGSGAQQGLSAADVQKRYKVGGLVKGRVIGFRLIDALVAMSLKESVLAQQVFSVKDLYPGQLLNVTVLDHTPAGVIVSITDTLKALVPRVHMSDTAAAAGSTDAKIPSKLKPGKTLPARVLSVNPITRRVEVTLKKGLLGSKLPVLAALKDAEAGMKLHGVVTGVEKYGVFVGFYGGVSGLMPNSQLDLLPGQEPKDLYSKGQLLRCQVASVDLRKQKLVLRPTAKKAGDDGAAAMANGSTAAAAADPWCGLLVGSVLEGGAVVQQVLQRAAEAGGGLVELLVTGINEQQVLAHLPAAHLSDHPGAVEALMTVIRPGMTLPGPLLVLQQRRLKTEAGDGRWQVEPQGGAEAADNDERSNSVGVPMLLVTQKAGLLGAAAAGRLPAAASEVKQGQVLPGYVASITKDAVYVRFLGRCTGRAGLPQLADTFVTDPARHFNVGQSVMAAVVAVEDGGRFAVSLKPSVAGTHEGSFVTGLMKDLELAAELDQAAEDAAAAAAAGDEGDGSSDGPAAAIDWAGLFPPGQQVTATVHELRDYGAVMDLADHPDVVGLVLPDHGGGPEAAQLQGSGVVKACVLDASKSQGIIELSLRPELVNIQQQQQQQQQEQSSGSSKRQKTAAKQVTAAAAAAAADGQQQQHVGAEVQVMVQLIKDHYVVVSLVQDVPQQQHQQQQGKCKRKAAGPAAEQQQQHVGIGFLPRCDINSQGAAGREARRFERGQLLAARVVALPSSSNGERLLLELTQPLQFSSSKAAAAAAKAGGSKAAVGGLVTATVVAVHEVELELVCGKASNTAHLHVSELQERLSEPPGHSLLSPYKLQQQLTAAWLGHVKGLGGRRGKDAQLSLRPSAIAAAKQGGDKAKIPAVLSAKDLNPGTKVVGWVVSASSDSLWLSLAPEIKGRVHVLESGDSPEQLKVPLEDRFSIGQGLAAVVLGIDPKHHTLDLSLRLDRLAAAAAAAVTPAAAAAAAVAANAIPAAGALVPGKVVSVSGSGVLVQLAPKLQGLVAITDIHDWWVPNALSGLSSGTFVQARVLAAPGSGAAAGQAAEKQKVLVDAKGRIMLSLRPSLGGSIAAAAAAAESDQGLTAAADVDVSGLKVGSKVQGYVRSVSSKGLFLALDRAHDARVKLSQLSDGFVEDPAAAFPVGSRLEGRVLSVEHTKPQPSAAPPEGAAPGSSSSSSSSPLQDDGVRVELSLRSSESPGQLRTLADIQEGELSGGKVRKIERYGVFVELNRSRVSGLVHISQIGKGFVKDLAAHYSPGQLVTVRVLSVDRDNNKVNLSMKPELLVADDDDDEDEETANGVGLTANGKPVGSRKRSAAAAAFDMDDEMVRAAELENSSSEDEETEEDDEDEDEDEEGDDEEEDQDEKDEEAHDQAEDVEMDDMDLSKETEESDESDQESEDEEAALPTIGLLNSLPPAWTGAGGAAAAAAAAGQGWGELQLTDDVPDSGAAAADADVKLSKADTKRRNREAEADCQAPQQVQPEQQGLAESAAGYEQQLKENPNSSLLWIRYMAFQLKLGEVAAARAVAERALATINMTAEEEKFAVWVALLNLENAYAAGDAEEAVMTVFKRALPYVEPKRLYLSLLGILERSSRFQLASDLWKTATKKFNTSCKVWLGAFEYALQQANRAEAAAKAAAAAADDDNDNNDDDAGPSPSAAATAGSDATAAAAAHRQVLERALKSLPRHKHIKALIRAALAEFRMGCPERGRSILESLVANHPKRTDLWSIYIDQEVKAGDAARVRSLLARATSLALPPKKMKVLFRRWLEYEQTHGSAADAAAVRQRAMEYMESQALGAGTAAEGE